MKEREGGRGEGGRKKEKNITEYTSSQSITSAGGTTKENQPIKTRHSCECRDLYRLQKSTSSPHFVPDAEIAGQAVRLRNDAKKCGGYRGPSSSSPGCWRVRLPETSQRVAGEKSEGETRLDGGQGGIRDSGMEQGS